MILCVLIIAHLLADFTFRFAKLASEKANKNSLIINSLIYAVILLITIFVFIEYKSGLFSFLIIVSSHFIIDWVKQLIDKKVCNKAIIFSAFLLDQLLHISILILIYYLLDLNIKTNLIFAYCQNWEYFNYFLIYALIFVIIWDPAAVFIKKLFAYIINENSSDHDDSDPQIGRIIGKLERMIISSLVLCNQFGAIGFVLAAKSIARYKQLEDKNFAEKYLVGTLTSTFIAFITALILPFLLK